jgi:hypothetical protein
MSNVQNDVRGGNHVDDDSDERHFETPIDRVEIPPMDESSLSKLTRDLISPNKRTKPVKVTSHTINLEEENLVLSTSGTSVASSSKVI